MKKIIWLYLFIQCSIIYSSSSSFFMPRSITHTAMYELALTDYNIYHSAPRCKGVSWYISPFYIRSNNQYDLARYFLPNNTCFLNIKEDGSGNIGSLWLNLMAEPGLSYSSLLSIAPQRKAAGAYFHIRFDANTLFMNHFWLIRNMWTSCTFAPMKVHHNLNIKEMLTLDKTYGDIPSIRTAIQAFNNKNWGYGKLSPCSLQKSGIDDLQIKFGTNCFFYQEQSHIGLYLIGSIPTGDKPCSQFLFEPIVGSNHGAFGFGSNVDFKLNDNNICTFHLMGDIKYRYLFSGCEIRSFDLCNNGDWSRYLLTTRNNATSISLPGINDMSMPIKVTPGSQIELWLALHTQWCKWDIEIGYNMWNRSKDSDICFLKKVHDNIGIYDISGAISNNPISASNANISQAAIPPNQAPSDSIFTQLHKFNISSGSQSKSSTNTIYGAISYNGFISDIPSICGFGYSYEFAHNFNAFAQWSIWGTLGLRF